MIYIIDFSNSNFLQSIVAIGIDFLNSNFLQSVAIVVSVILGLKFFYSKQRTNRLQKLYFDDGVLKQVREIDEGLTMTQQNIYAFTSVIDEISNLIKQTVVDRDIIFKSLEKKIFSIKEFGQFGESASEIATFLIPSEQGDHITQWFRKYNADIGAFSAIVRGQLFILLNELSISNSRRNKTKDEVMLEKMVINIGKLQKLMIRHRVMVNLYSRLARLYADLKFSDSDELVSTHKNPKFTKIIKNLDESFKILFCFYETPNKSIYYSYAKDEDGKHFKIVFENESNVKITREMLNENPKGKLNIIINDTAIGNAIIEDTKNNFVMGLVGMTNLRNFERRPNIIAEKQRFI